MNRRRFLKRTAAAGITAGLVTQSLATKYAFAETGYSGDVLVVLSLRGGFDGVNAVVPTFEANYRNLRPNVSIPESQLIPLDSQFGMHPSMQPLLKYWESGTFGVVHAVGMQNPTRSHFMAMAEMERAAPGTTIRSGWIDRTLELRTAGTAYQGVQVGLNRASMAFNGQTPELSLLSVDSFTLAQGHTTAERDKWRTALMGINEDAPAFIASPSRTATDAVETAAQLASEGYAPRDGVAYPRTELGAAMKDVAHLIKDGVGLQVACVDFGDWDMHAGMGTVGAGWFHSHLSELAMSMAAFADDLGPAMAQVNLVTLSEFGRRLKENGSGGTDHGHGQAVLMLGGGVKGGQVHGQWPGLNDDQLVDGDLAGTTDYRNLLAELLEKRCGASQLSTIFPGLTSDRLGAFTTPM